MKTKLQGILVLAVAAVLVAGVAAQADEQKSWVSEDGHVIGLHAGHDAMFVSEDGETFDLSDLLDGETRTFGEGDKQVSVTRTGDVVAIDRTAAGATGKLELKCDVSRDSCQVITFADQPEKVMIMVKKSRECIGGVGDCEATVDVAIEDLDLGEGAHAIIRKVKCDDAGNCETFEDVHGGGEMEIIADVHRAGPGNVMILRTDGTEADHVMLRCPEGDATVRVAKAEAGDTFLCPKHSVPMEQVEGGAFIRKFHVKTGDDD